jgi:hypothetical protein
VFVIVAQTIIHEAGHYFGLDEDAIERIEREYWDALDPDGPGDAESDDPR